VANNWSESLVGRGW